MNRASSLSGDTLIACHFPLVQLSPWQLPVQAALCGSAKRPARLSSAGLTRAASLPEQDCLHRDAAAAHGALRHTSSTYCSLKEDRGEDEDEDEDDDGGGGSDSSGRCDSASSSPEEEALPRAADSQWKKERPSSAARGAPRTHNSFLPNVEAEEHEEDEDSDGDNLHRYHEDSSFVLHGNSNWASRDGAGFASTMTSTRSHDQLDSATTWHVQEGALYEQQHESNAVLMDCEGEESEWRRDKNEDDLQKYNGCFGYDDQPKCLPESFSNGRQEAVSDSSCNSSDGVLVNFSAIYSGSNNPATPNDLGTPAASQQPSKPAEGSVFLNLQPFPQRKEVQDRGEAGSSPQYMLPSSAPSWSPQGLDSNCNLYPPNLAEPQDPQAQGLSSLEASDLNACLQSQARLAIGTTQKYYKLVTCDLSSQSSQSPAWSSLTSNSPAPSPAPRASPAPGAEYFLFSKAQDEQLQQGGREKEQQKARRKSTPMPSGCGFHWPCCDSWVPQHNVNTFAEMVHCKSQCSSNSQTSQDLCTIQEAIPLGQSNCQAPLAPGSNHDTVTTHPTPGREPCEAEAEMEGACSWDIPVVRFSKAQRPTSLPIQPFVLLSSPGKPQSQAQALGSLLDQYIGSKNTRPSYTQPASRCRGKGNRLLTHLRPSPLGGHGPILLEAPSSSDTCSTCTPSPERLQPRPGWARSNRGQGQMPTSPSRPYTSPSRGLPLLSPMLSCSKAAHAPAGIDQTSPYLSTPQTDTLLPQTYVSPNRSGHSPSARTWSSPGKPQICYDLVQVSPVRPRIASDPEPVTHSPHCGPVPSHHHHHHHHTPSSPPPIDQGLLVSLPPTPPPQKLSLPPSAPALDPVLSFYNLTAALSSMAPLSSLSSLLTAGPAGRSLQPGDASTLSDRPPVEFSLSPEASYESLSISHLQRRGLLKSVSLAVDLIMAHFGTSRDPEEKIRLGNSSRSPTIGGLVLEHLCPTIQNILQDGLRDHRLDLIIGQLPNHSWNVVEVATQTGPSTRVLHSLVNKVRHCPLLASPSVRLRAFIMGLLNLRSLEFWLSHLHSQKDVVAAHYHPWGFLPMTQGRCQPLFQELLLLLQPLSVLPFELNLLMEPRLLQIGQLCCEEPGVAPPPPCSTLLMTRWPLLRGDAQRQEASASGQGPRDSRGLRGEEPHRQGPQLRGSSPGEGAEVSQERRQRHVGRSNRWSSPSPGWWQRQPIHVQGVEDCNQDYGEGIRPRAHGGPEGGDREGIRPRAHGGPEGGDREGIRLRAHGGPEERDGEAPGATADQRDVNLAHGGLRWAKLFGWGVEPSTRTVGSQSFNGTQTKRRPSEWLQLDRSQLGLLAQSVWSGKRAGPGPGPGPHPDHCHTQT